MATKGPLTQAAGGLERALSSPCTSLAYPLVGGAPSCRIVSVSLSVVRCKVRHVVRIRAGPIESHALERLLLITVATLAQAWFKQ